MSCATCTHKLSPLDVAVTAPLRCQPACLSSAKFCACAVLSADAFSDVTSLLLPTMCTKRTAAAAAAAVIRAALAVL